MVTDQCTAQALVTSPCNSLMLLYTFLHHRALLLVSIMAINTIMQWTSHSSLCLFEVSHVRTVNRSYTICNTQVLHMAINGRELQHKYPFVQALMYNVSPLDKQTAFSSPHSWLMSLATALCNMCRCKCHHWMLFGCFQC